MSSTPSVPSARSQTRRGSPPSGGRAAATLPPCGARPRAALAWAQRAQRAQHAERAQRAVPDTPRQPAKRRPRGQRGQPGQPPLWSEPAVLLSHGHTQHAMPCGARPRAALAWAQHVQRAQHTKRAQRAVPNTPQPPAERRPRGQRGQPGQPPLWSEPAVLLSHGHTQHAQHGKRAQRAVPDTPLQPAERRPRGQRGQSPLWSEPSHADGSGQLDPTYYPELAQSLYYAPVRVLAVWSRDQLPGSRVWGSGFKAQQRLPQRGSSLFGARRGRRPRPGIRVQALNPKPWPCALPHRLECGAAPGALREHAQPGSLAACCGVCRATRITARSTLRSTWRPGSLRLRSGRQSRPIVAGCGSTPQPAGSRVLRGAARQRCAGKRAGERAGSGCGTQVDGPCQLQG